MAKIIGNFSRGSREPIDQSYTVLNLAILTADTINPNPYTSLRTWVSEEQKFYIYDCNQISNGLNGWVLDDNQTGAGGLIPAGDNYSFQYKKTSTSLGGFGKYTPFLRLNNDIPTGGEIFLTTSNITFPPVPNPELITCKSNNIFIGEEITIDGYLLSDDCCNVFLENTIIGSNNKIGGTRNVILGSASFITAENNSSSNLENIAIGYGSDIKNSQSCTTLGGSWSRKITNCYNSAIINGEDIFLNGTSGTVLIGGRRSDPPFTGTTDNVTYVPRICLYSKESSSDVVDVEEGLIRYNTNNFIEFHDGNKWNGLLTSGTSLGVSGLTTYDVFDSVDGSNLQFNRIKAGNNVNISKNNGVLTIDNISGSGTITGATNLGNSGTSIYDIYESNDNITLGFNRIKAGNNVTINKSNNVLTINATVSGGTGGLVGTNVTPGTYTKLVVNDDGLVTSGLTGNTLAFYGITNALTSRNITAGTYTKLTVNNDGLVTAGQTGNTLSYYNITDATPLSHVGSGGVSHALATTNVSGFMSFTDKTRLDSLYNNGLSVDLSAYQLKNNRNNIFNASTILLDSSKKGFTFGKFLTNIPKNNSNYITFNNDLGNTMTNALTLAYGSDNFISLKNETASSGGTSFGNWVHYKKYENENEVKNFGWVDDGGDIILDWVSYKKFILTSYTSNPLPMNIKISNLQTGEISLHIFMGDQIINLPSGWWVNGELKPGYNVLTFQNLLTWADLNWKVINIAQYDLIP